jgi:Na+/H+ antiporter NhaD/arsenite permease-like protein
MDPPGWPHGGPAVILRAPSTTLKRHMQSNEWVPRAVFGLSPLWVSTGLLVATYVVIMTERVNRALVAGIGASLMIVLGVLDQEAAIEGVDFNTIMLLAGMMLIVGVTKQSGMFQYVAIWSAKKVKASPAGILLALSLATAGISALLDNVTTVLLVVPVTIAITRELKVPPYPFLFAQIIASNIGGTATLVGDPPNIVIGSAVGFTFNEFVVNLAPVILVILAVTAGILHLVYGRHLEAAPEDRARVLAMNERDAITDPVLLRHCLGVLAAVIAAFVLAREIHLEAGTIAMFGAAVLLLLENWPHKAEDQSHRIHARFGDVEWITLFFFMGLFIVVAGVERAGLLRLLAEKVLGWTGGDLALTTVTILWVSAILSAIVDNIPFVVTMVPLIESLAPGMGGREAIEPLWWALSLGACLGGNGTLIGASANLTVAGLAERQGIPFRFMTYTRQAFPLTLLSIALAHVYLYLRYL